MPFAVAAPPAAAGQAVARLEKLPGSPLDPHAVADEATARRQLLNRDIDGALVIDPAGGTDRLLAASGGGALLAATLEKYLTVLEASQRRTVRTVDVAPASPQDFNAPSSFYLVVGWCVGGCLCASVLAISTGARPANVPRALIRLGVMALVAIGGGLGGAVVVGPILGALPGSAAALWWLGALTTFAVGAATLALLGRRITLRPQAEYEAIQQARAQENTQEWKEQYAHRAGVEGTLSQGVRACGLRRCRYHGLTKARLQHQLTATAMNFHRLNAWRTDTPRARTRTSRLAALRPAG